MQTNLRSRILSSFLISFAALVLLGGGSCQKKTDFTSGAAPAPVQPDPGANNPGSTASPEPIGSDFAEKPLSDTDNSAGYNEDQSGAGADEVAANMKTVYFEYDSFDLSGEALSTLANNAAWLRSKPGVRVLIEGHCDERGSIEYNLDLGAKRARIVQAQLLRLGIDANRLSTVSKGETEPADTTGTDTAFARNRRAEFEKAP